MFNSVIQPTGIYGNFPTTLGSAPLAGQSLGGSAILPETSSNAQSPSLNENKPKKRIKRSILSKLALVLALALGGAVGAIWGLPVLNKKLAPKFAKISNARHLPFESENMNNALKALGKKLDEAASVLDNKVQIPFKNFMQQNVFSYIKTRWTP